MDQIAMTVGYFVLICGLGALVFGVLSFVAYLILLAWEAFSYRFRATLKAEKTILEFRKKPGEVLGMEGAERWQQNLIAKIVEN